eukprot:5545870-Prymnesium_polylepis.1
MLGAAGGACIPIAAFVVVIPVSRPPKRRSKAEFAAPSAALAMPSGRNLFRLRQPPRDRTLLLHAPLAARPVAAVAPRAPRAPSPHSGGLGVLDKGADLGVVLGAVRLDAARHVDAPRLHLPTRTQQGTAMPPRIARRVSSRASEGRTGRANCAHAACARAPGAAASGVSWRGAPGRWRTRR